MFDLIKRLSNKDALPITQILEDKKVIEKLNLSDKSKKDQDDLIYSLSKTIYKELTTHISFIDNSSRDELYYLIENIEFDEQIVLNYFKSALWNYNRIAEAESDKLYKEVKNIFLKI